MGKQEQMFFKILLNKTKMSTPNVQFTKQVITVYVLE